MKRIFILSLVIIAEACSSGTMNRNSQASEDKILISSNTSGKGPEIVIDLTKGPSFYYPLLAVWIEDSDGKYIQTLYVAESVGKGVFIYGKPENNKWVRSAKRAPQTLPYWAHKRGIIASDGLYIPDSLTAVPDAYSGATPVSGFMLSSRADYELPENYRIMLEINQNWDWNEYWTNDKFPDDQNYKMSCQPALVYSAEINSRSLKDSYNMKPVGHSHYSGKTGELFTDLSTMTTALQIAGSIVVKIR